MGRQKALVYPQKPLESSGDRFKIFTPLLQAQSRSSLPGCAGKHSSPSLCILLGFCRLCQVCGYPGRRLADRFCSRRPNLVCGHRRKRTRIQGRFGMGHSSILSHPPHTTSSCLSLVVSLRALSRALSRNSLSKSSPSIGNSGQTTGSIQRPPCASNDG